MVIGVPHLKDGDALPQGGRPGWAAPPCPRIGPWLILLNKLAQSHDLIPEFEVGDDFHPGYIAFLKSLACISHDASRYPHTRDVLND